MEDKQMDGKIREALRHGTDAAAQMQDVVWADLQVKLRQQPREAGKLMGEQRQRKQKIARLIKFGAAAAALAVALLVGTEPGQAAIDKLKELFVPEKTIVEQIEGNDEKTDVKIEGNIPADATEVGYVIYFDQERYRMEKGPDGDRIVMKEQPANIPPVYMEIRQVKGQRPAAVAREIERQLKAEFPNVQAFGEVTEPLPAIHYYANSGSNWNSTVVKYYLFDNTKGGTFVVKQQLFLEASEGHGVRFDNMLKEFKIIELPKE